jgi:hypothetical protein
MGTLYVPEEDSDDNGVEFELVSLKSISIPSIRVDSSSVLLPAEDPTDGEGNTFLLQISIPVALRSFVLIQCTGVTHHSKCFPSRPLFVSLSFNGKRILVRNDAAEKDGLLIQSRGTSMRVFVIECSPGGGALLSNPAMVSMTANWDVVAEPAAAHVSKRINTPKIY